jgi:drug/metabolite transporter (DMT)-like permease
MSNGLALAFVLALGAAFLHALWNVLLKTSHDPLKVSTVAVASAMMVATPFAFVAWLLTGRPGLPGTAWVLAGISSLLELGYFIFLSEAYRRGDLSIVYPIARGTAPLLTVPIGLIVLREHLAGVEIGGILLMLAGIWAVRRPAPTGDALLPALLTGVSIAAYSSLDRVGVRLTDAWLYGWALGTMTALVLVLWATFKEGWSFQELMRSPLPASPQAVAQVRSSPQASTLMPQASCLRPHLPTPTPQTAGLMSHLRAPFVGILMISAWMMILAALSVAPLSVVSPLRESAIVLVTAWGIWRLKERDGLWLRIGGALAIVIGAALLALQ